MKTKVLVYISLLLLLISGINVSASQNIGKETSPYLISFPSYINVDYDSAILNDPLPIDQTINIPLTISYSTDIPENFGRFLPWQLRNYILYKSMFEPLQQLTLEVIDVPEWADIYFIEPVILIDIPFTDSTSVVQTNLHIALEDDAPALAQSINIKVSCKKIGRIQARTVQKLLSFTPEYQADINIHTNTTIIHTPPTEIVPVMFHITNHGNKKTRINPEMTTDLEGWYVEFAPPFLDINPGETEISTLILRAPEEFEGYEIITISFYAPPFPLMEDDLWTGPFNVTIIAEFEDV